MRYLIWFVVCAVIVLVVGSLISWLWPDAPLIVFFGLGVVVGMATFSIADR